ncbi:MAG: sugar phosphate isomerase/epimerase [Verrucomicrobia bacterium]|nr:sugar phosphate isomerase/epimerase [Verrucomicrobiota bacterium]
MNSLSKSPSTSAGALSRRGALKLAASAFAAPALAMTVAATAPAKNPLWKTAVGLNSFSSGTRKYGKVYPIWEVLDFVAQLGYDGIELVGGWPMGDYPKSTETERIRALRRFHDAYRLQVFSIQTGAGGAFAPDEAARRKWVEEFRDRVKFCKQVGCDCIGVWPSGGLRGQTLDEALKRLAGSFRETAQIAADAGLIMAFEIEPPFVFNKEEHLQRILEHARHPSLKVIYDPSHFDLMNGSTGKPHEMLLRIGVKNIGYVQLTDTDGTLRDGGTSKHLPCGDGHAHIAESLRVLREGGFRGWMDMDGWEIPDPYDACVKAKKMIDAAAR